MVPAPRLPTNTRKLSRRQFLAMALSSAPLLVSPLGAMAAAPPASAEKKLRLFNPKTKTLLETIFWAKGAYVPAALSEIDFLMRDLRCGKTISMDTRLIELLYAIQVDLQLDEPFHVVSAFRTRESNERLRKQGWAAAKNSYHIHGKAVDIRLSSASTAMLRRAAFKLKQGGVGYYPRLNFVHLDIGPVRFWRRE